MEDVTDISFRTLCKEFGADMVYSEFISADALIRNIENSTRKMNINDKERPVAIQIYGREPEPIRDAAIIAEEANPDIIDLNFVSKYVSANELKEKVIDLYKQGYKNKDISEMCKTSPANVTRIIKNYKNEK
jgi:DNA-binding NarL/FixJ family response regulator